MLMYLWIWLAEQYRFRAETLECVAHNSWLTICELCDIIKLAEARRVQLEAEQALLRAAVAWYTGTDPDDLLRDYRLSLIEQERGGPPV